MKAYSVLLRGIAEQQITVLADSPSEARAKARVGNFVDAGGYPDWTTNPDGTWRHWCARRTRHRNRMERRLMITPPFPSRNPLRRWWTRWTWRHNWPSNRELDPIQHCADAHGLTPPRPPDDVVEAAARALSAHLDSADVSWAAMAPAVRDTRRSQAREMLAATCGDRPRSGRGIPLCDCREEELVRPDGTCGCAAFDGRFERQLVRAAQERAVMDVVAFLRERGPTCATREAAYFNVKLADVIEREFLK